MSAITAGSRSPATSAASISREEVPVMFDATDDSLIEASSSSPNLPACGGPDTHSRTGGRPAAPARARPTARSTPRTPSVLRPGTAVVGAAGGARSTPRRACTPSSPASRPARRHGGSSCNVRICETRRPRSPGVRTHHHQPATRSKTTPHRASAPPRLTGAGTRRDREPHALKRQQSGDPSTPHRTLHGLSRTRVFTTSPSDPPILTTTANRSRSAASTPLAPRSGAPL